MSSKDYKKAVRQKCKKRKKPTQSCRLWDVLKSKIDCGFKLWKLCHWDGWTKCLGQNVFKNQKKKKKWVKLFKWDVKLFWLSSRKPVIASLGLKVNLILISAKNLEYFYFFQPKIVLYTHMTWLLQIKVLPLSPVALTGKAAAHSGEITNKDHLVLSRSRAKDSSYVWCAVVF